MIFVVTLLTISILIILTLGVCIMATAIENLNAAVSDLQATINEFSLPVVINNDAAIQTAADNIAAANAALKAKVA